MIGIIGSGLGGLLAGANLVKRGYEVAIFEKLPYPGGRFTNIEYKGYQLSTGALHMIPHGRKGPFGKMLGNLGINIEIFISKPEAYFRINGRDLLFGELAEPFTVVDKVKLAALVGALKFGSGSSETFYEWIKRRMKNPLVFQIADAFCGWSLSVNSAQITSKEVMAITRNINKFGGPGIPAGGCKGVTNALVEFFESEGGKIFYKSRVQKINIRDGRVTGVSTSKGDFNFDAVISDIGPKATLKLSDEKNFNREHIKLVNEIQEVAGIKICVACDKQMLGHSGVLFTPQAKRINGINEVTNADPKLAPDGKHLMMSHQYLNPKNDVKKEIRLGIKDLHSLFPDFKKYCKVLMVQTYRNHWPVNRAISGVHISPKAPIKGLYYVGDAIKPEGWMETEGVAAGVEILMRYLT